MSRRRTLGAVAVAFVVVTVVTVALWGGDDERRRSDTFRSINELRGQFRGVGIGDDPRAIRSAFGEVPFAGANEPFTPTKSDFIDVGGPTIVRIPCRPSRSRPRPPRALLRYDEVSFLFCAGASYAVMITADEARTTRGVAIGDELQRARDVYPGLVCSDAPAGDSGDSYPYCAGAITADGGTPLHVWFGEDPIGSITVSTTAFDGYER